MRRLLVLASIVLAGLAVTAVQMDVPLHELLRSRPRTPTDAAGVRKLEHLLESQDSLERLEVTRTLGAMDGPGVPAAVAVLRRAVKDTDPGVRLEALKGLARMGLAARPAAPELVPLLEYRYEPAGELALGILIATLDRDAARPLIPDLLERAVARYARQQQLLWRLSPEDVIPLLVPLLTQGSAERRVKAIELAAGFGASAASAAPAIRAALVDGDDTVVVAAIAALSAIVPDPSSALLISGLLAHPSARVRSEAAEGLERIGKPASPALPALKGLLADPDEGVRVRVARAMAIVSGDPREGAQFLTAYLKGNSRFAWQAMPALAALKVATPDAIDAIASKLTEGSAEDCGIAPAAAKALAELGPPAAAALPRLERALVHPCAWARMEIAKAIHAVGAGTSHWHVVRRMAETDSRLREVVDELARPREPAAAH